MRLILIERIDEPVWQIYVKVLLFLTQKFSLLCTHFLSNLPLVQVIDGSFVEDAQEVLFVCELGLLDLIGGYDELGQLMHVDQVIETSSFDA